MRKSLDVLDRRLNMSLTTKLKVAKFSFLNEKSYNKTVIDFNFGRHKDLSTLKSDIHLGLAASVNYHFFRLINPYVYLIEVNNCIISLLLKKDFFIIFLLYFKCFYYSILWVFFSPKHEQANIKLLSLQHIWEADFGYIAFFVTPILDNWLFRR